MAFAAPYIHSLPDFFIDPRSAFAGLARHRGWGWATLALLIAAHVIASLVFFGAMTPEWIVEQQLAGMTELSPQEAGQLQGQMQAFAGSYAIIAAIAGGIVLAASTVVLGLVYFALNRTAQETRFGFGAWCGFSVMTQLPLLLGYAGMIALSLLSTDRDLPFAAASFASLNTLLLDLQAEHPMRSWADALSLFTLWSAALAVIGYRHWTGASLVRSLFCGSAPYLAVFGIWGVLA